MGIYVINAGNGARISIGQGILRYIILHLGILAVTIWVLFASATMPTQTPSSQDEQQAQRMLSINKKILAHEKLSADEQQENDQNTKNMLVAADIPDADQQRFFAIAQKQKMGEPLTADEQQFSGNIFLKMASAGRFKRMGWAYLMTAYMLLIALMVGLTKEKTGLHDLIVKTRVVRGQPDRPVLEGQ